MKGIKYRLLRLVELLKPLDRMFCIRMIIADHFDPKMIACGLDLNSVVSCGKSLLTLNNISSTLNHYDCMQHIAKHSQDDDVNMVIEDDVFAYPHMPQSLEAITHNLPQGYDVVLLGASKHLPLSSTEAYLLSRKAAQGLAGRCLPFNAPFNEHFSRLISVMDVITPNCTLFRDGSKTGEDISYVTLCNQLTYNKDYCDFVAATAKSPIDWCTVKKLMNESPSVSHPDFLYAIGEFCTRCGYKDVGDKYYGAAKKGYYQFVEFSTCRLSSSSSR